MNKSYKMTHNFIDSFGWCIHIVAKMACMSKFFIARLSLWSSQIASSNAFVLVLAVIVFKQHAEQALWFPCHHCCTVGCKRYHFLHCESKWEERSSGNSLLTERLLRYYMNASFIAEPVSPIRTTSEMCAVYSRASKCVQDKTSTSSRFEMSFHTPAKKKRKIFVNYPVP